MGTVRHIPGSPSKTTPIKYTTPDYFAKAKKGLADGGRVSQSKAKKIMADGKIRGKKLSSAQRGFFGAIAGGAAGKRKKMAKGGRMKYRNGGEVEKDRKKDPTFLGQQTTKAGQLRRDADRYSRTAKEGYTPLQRTLAAALGKDEGKYRQTQARRAAETRAELREMEDQKPATGRQKKSPMAGQSLPAASPYQDGGKVGDKKYVKAPAPPEDLPTPEKYKTKGLTTTRGGTVYEDRNDPLKATTYKQSRVTNRSVYGKLPADSGVRRGMRMEAFEKSRGRKPNKQEQADIDDWDLKDGGKVKAKPAPMGELTEKDRELGRRFIGRLDAPARRAAATKAKEKLGERKRASGGVRKLRERGYKEEEIRKTLGGEKRLADGGKVGDKYKRAPNPPEDVDTGKVKKGLTVKAGKEKVSDPSMTNLRPDREAKYNMHKEVLKKAGRSASERDIRDYLAKGGKVKKKPPKISKKQREKARQKRNLKEFGVKQPTF